MGSSELSCFQLQNVKEQADILGVFCCSLLGMVFLFSGLYVVLWAKKKEGQVIPAVLADGTTDDMGKPLLLPH